VKYFIPYWGLWLLYRDGGGYITPSATVWTVVAQGAYLALPIAWVIAQLVD